MLYICSRNMYAFVTIHVCSRILSNFFSINLLLIKYHFVIKCISPRSQKLCRKNKYNVNMFDAATYFYTKVLKTSISFMMPLYECWIAANSLMFFYKFDSCYFWPLSYQNQRPSLKGIRWRGAASFWQSITRAEACDFVQSFPTSFIITGRGKPPVLGPPCERSFHTSDFARRFVSSIQRQQQYGQ